jgi:hypothetical protein
MGVGAIGLSASVCPAIVKGVRVCGVVVWIWTPRVQGKREAGPGEERADDDGRASARGGGAVAAGAPASHDVFCELVLVGVVDAARQPKVADLQVAVLVHQQVARLKPQRSEREREGGACAGAHRAERRRVSARA